jgi:hypothetical protein
MMSQEQLFARAYADTIAEFEAAFPGIKPPEPFWFSTWITKYGFRDVSVAIRTLAGHPMKARFTTESTGRALSALLRAEALRRAIPGAPASGGQS